jgi:two-component system sensor histidine kinase BaeS
MMFSTLRRRLILSHALPLLIIIPLTGIALIYVLETQVVLANLATEVKGQAALLAEIVIDRADIWSDPAQAQAFVNRVEPQLSSPVMLLDPQGRLLASSDQADASRIGQTMQFAGLDNALAGKSNVRTVYSQNLDVEVVDVMTPVIAPNGRVIGIVRLTHRLASVYEQFLRLRSLIASILGVALVLGVAVGWVLALNLERPLRQMTMAVYRLAGGQQLTPLPEQGPEEVRLLLHAFNILTERLRNVEETRRQLLSSLVHELGTPLGALNSGIQALRSGADQQVELRQELLAGMEEEISKLRRLLDDLARLSDQFLGGVKLTLHPVRLSEWLPRALATWRQAAQAKGLEWQLSLPPELPALPADSDRLAQVLGNLLSNAIKYTKPGGRVSVAAGREHDQVWIRVSDTGQGIPLDEQQLIFTPFYRGRSAGRFPKGMGLGLAIAKDLVAAHGGHLDVKSAPGEGAHFTLWLPLKLRT